MVCFFSVARKRQPLVSVAHAMATVAILHKICLQYGDVKVDIPDNLIVKDHGHCE